MQPLCPDLGPDKAEVKQPLLILSPYEHWGSLRRQGLCSNIAQFWAILDSPPMLSIGDPREGRSYVAILPTFGPPRRQW